VPGRVTIPQVLANYLSERIKCIVRGEPYAAFASICTGAGPGMRMARPSVARIFPENVMNRRQSLKWLFALSVPGLTSAVFAGAKDSPGLRLLKSKSDWASLLPPPAYRVLFEEDTERAGTSPLNHEKRDGTFVCAACYLPLFDSTKKYESGTGWPSFWQPLPDAVAARTDFKIIFPRTEYHCARCGGHQGHIFDDGPQPTGKRYCNNGIALQFVQRAEKLPALRT